MAKTIHGYTSRLERKVKKTNKNGTKQDWMEHFKELLSEEKERKYVEKMECCGDDETKEEKLLHTFIRYLKL